MLYVSSDWWTILSNDHFVDFITMRYNTEGKNFFIAHEPFREFSNFHCDQMKIIPDDNCWKGSSFPRKRSNANQYNTFLSQREVGSILLCSLVFLIPFFFLNLVISVFLHYLSMVRLTTFLAGDSDGITISFILDWFQCWVTAPFGENPVSTFLPNQCPGNDS